MPWQRLTTELKYIENDGNQLALRKKAHGMSMNFEANLLLFAFNFSLPV